jgi:hypothetical protein
MRSGVTELGQSEKTVRYEDTSALPSTSDVSTRCRHRREVPVAHMTTDRLHHRRACSGPRAGSDSCHQWGGGTEAVRHPTTLWHSGCVVAIIGRRPSCLALFGTKSARTSQKHFAWFILPVRTAHGQLGSQIDHSHCGDHRLVWRFGSHRNFDVMMNEDRPTERLTGAVPCLAQRPAPCPLAG